MKKILLVFILIVSTILMIGCDDSKLREAVDPNDNTELFITVPKGASTKSIAKILHKNHVISSESAFVNFVKELEVGNKLQAGDYMFQKSMGMDSIINIIASGQVYRNTFKIAIPEGFEIRQIVERLASKGYVDSEKFMNVLETGEFDYKFLEGNTLRNNLEGYLFPATYEFEVGVSEYQIINAMLAQFDKVFTEEYYQRAEALGMTITEVVTLASIVEREAKLDTERTTVSSVFHNRLNTNYKLESCATIQYILGERKERLLYSDLEIVSDFNTYKNVGLPPAPIASPGALSIEAALYPENTDYMFFVVTGDPDGSHVFTRTYEEHNKAKNNRN